MNDSDWVKIETYMKYNGDKLTTDDFSKMLYGDSIVVAVNMNDQPFTIINHANEEVPYSPDSVVAFVHIQPATTDNSPALFTAYIPAPKDGHFDHPTPDGGGNWKIKVIRPGESCYPGGAKCPATYVIRNPWFEYHGNITFCPCFMS